MTHADNPYFIPPTSAAELQGHVGGVRTFCVKMSDCSSAREIGYIDLHNTDFLIIHYHSCAFLCESHNRYTNESDRNQHRNQAPGV